MSDKYAKELENRTEHNHIMDTLMEVKDTLGEVRADGAYTRGKIDAMEKNQGNMWTWFISLGACAIAWFKGV
jgi:hypothetical protein